MSERTKVKGERIAFTIDKSTFEQLDKILYMQRKTVKDILIPMVQSYVEQNKNEIKRYDKTFNIETATPVSDKPPTVTTKTTDTTPIVLTPEQRAEAVNIICKFIIDNDSHFYIKGDDTLKVEKPAYGTKNTDYIAVEKEPLKALLTNAGLDARTVFGELKVQTNFEGKTSYRMAKVTTSEFETYKHSIAQNGTTETNDTDRNDDQ